MRALFKDSYLNHGLSFEQKLSPFFLQNFQRLFSPIIPNSFHNIEYSAVFPKVQEKPEAFCPVVQEKTNKIPTQEPLVLGQKRNRYVKNHKLVFIHPKNKLKKFIFEDNEEYLELEKENTEKRKSFKERKARGSRFRGVSKNGHQWQVLIMVNKKKRYVGSYSNEEEAARAYDKVALQNHGCKAKTNFDYLEEEVEKILAEPPLLKVID